MELIDYQIICIYNNIGKASIADFQETENIEQYTKDLLKRAMNQQDRRYRFNENKRTTRERVLSIALNESIGKLGLELGSDLSNSEKCKNEEIKHLKPKYPLAY